MSRQILKRHMASTGTMLACAAVAIAASGAATVLRAAAVPTKTHITLSADTRETAGQTDAVFTASVLAEDGTPATGAVVLMEDRAEIAGAALDKQGNAVLTLRGLAGGDHLLSAVYRGDGVHASATSAGVAIHPEANANPDFSIGVAPASVTLKPGASAISVTTITPLNGFTGFISLSCSGLPIGVTCTFTPPNLQAVATTTSLTADLGIQTTAPAGQEGAVKPPAGANGKRHPLVLAVLLPGIGALVYAGRKRKLMSRSMGHITMLALLGTVCVLGTSACNARYKYLNHPPTYNGGTPTGSYTITVTAQTSNGVTATEHSIPLALVVN